MIMMAISFTSLSNYFCFSDKSLCINNLSIRRLGTRICLRQISTVYDRSMGTMGCTVVFCRCQCVSINHITFLFARDEGKEYRGNCKNFVT